MLRGASATLLQGILVRDAECRASPRLPGDCQSLAFVALLGYPFSLHLSCGPLPWAHLCHIGLRRVHSILVWPHLNFDCISKDPVFKHTTFQGSGKDISPGKTLVIQYIGCLGVPAFIWSFDKESPYAETRLTSGTWPASFSALSSCVSAPCPVICQCFLCYTMYHIGVPDVCRPPRYPCCRAGWILHLAFLSLLFTALSHNCWSPL